MTVMLAIDPGTTESAFVLFNGARVVQHGIEANAALRHRLSSRAFMPDGPMAAVVLEQVESFGMAVGREVFETVFWTGRLYEAAHRSYGPVVERLPRRLVKLHLCHSARAKDGNIRQALVDLFGGKAAAIGLKLAPGPLYGIRSHEWAALALAVAWWETKLATKAVAS